MSTGRPRSAPGSSSGERRSRRARPAGSSSPGLGLVTALGTDVAATWDGLVAGRSGIRPITAFDAVAGRLADRRRGARLRPVGRPRPQGAAPQRPLHAARPGGRARGARPGRPAGAPRRASSPSGPGSSWGPGSAAGSPSPSRSASALEKGPDRISPFFIPMAIPNIAAGQVAIAFGAARARTSPSSSACATGGHAIGEAWEIDPARRRRRACSPARPRPAIHEVLVGGFAAMRALSTRNDDPAGGVAAVRPGPRRLRHRRRVPASSSSRTLEHARGARRDAARRARRLRRVGRREPHHPARARRGRRDPGGPARAREGRPGRRTTWST